MIGALTGIGFYVYSRSSNKPVSKTNNTTTTTQTKPTNEVMTPDQSVVQLTRVFKSKDKAKFEGLISDEMKADAEANGVSSVYDSFAEDEFTSLIFTGLDYSKEKSTITDYTSKKDVKGKTVTYNITTEEGAAKSVNVYKFSFVPKGSGWLLDDMSLDSDSNANIDTSAPTSQ